MEIKNQNFESMSKEELIYILKNLKYGLIWSGNENTKEQFEKESENAYPVLKGVPDKDIIINEEKPANILIEGDNYHVLSVLQYTHKNSIDFIYIDPPYNTGNKDFIYNDKFVDKEDTWRHSKWLSFMSKRLRLARELLKDEGIIFISIDDNEFAQLKLLMDEIFSENNFIATLPTIMNLKGNQDQFGFAGTHEYTLVYAKNKAKCKINEFDIDEEELEGWMEDEFGLYKKGANLKATGIDAPREKRGKMYYPILHKDGELFTITEEEYLRIYNEKTKEFDDEYVEELRQKYESLGYDFILPINNSGEKVRWRWGWSKENHRKLKNEVIVIKTTDGISIYKKQRPENGNLPSKKPKTLFYKPEYSSGNGTAQLKEIFEGKKVFENPKPLQLIKDFIKIGTRKNAIVLDFFAGSGTTGHAVMELNKEDGGNRQFILVTNNENNICTDVTYPRLKKIIEGYVNLNGEKVEGFNENLKYFKTDFVPKNSNNDQLMSDLVRKCTDILCIKENAFTLISDTRHYKIFKSPDKVMAVYTSIPSYSNFEKLNEEFSKFEGKKILYCFTLNPLGINKEYLEMLNVLKDVQIEPIPHQLKAMLDEALKIGNY